MDNDCDSIVRVCVDCGHESLAYVCQMCMSDTPTEEKSYRCVTCGLDRSGRLSEEERETRSCCPNCGHLSPAVAHPTHTEFIEEQTLMDGSLLGIYRIEVWKAECKAWADLEDKHLGQMQTNMDKEKP